MRQHLAQNLRQGNVFILLIQPLDGIEKQVGVGAGIVIQERDPEDVVPKSAGTGNHANYETGFRNAAALWSGPAASLNAAVHPVHIHSRLMQNATGISFGSNYDLLR